MIPSSSINDFLTMNFKWQSGCYQIRNDDLIVFIRKYIEGVIKEGHRNNYNIYEKCRG
ncbi:MAG: hypothetical protein SVR08_16765 [Spirochaetota bacterium]|nr:hypothetical protein [Spirochaetota bacterium]